MTIITNATFEMLKAYLGTLSFCHDVAIERVDYLDEAVLPFIVSLSFDDKSQPALLNALKSFCKKCSINYDATFTDFDENGENLSSVVIELISN